MRVRCRIVAVAGDGGLGRWWRVLACGVTWLLAGGVTTGGAATFDVATVAELRSALAAAAGNGEDDVVNLSAGTYAVGSVVTYSSAEGRALTLSGAGPAATVLDGGLATQVLDLTALAPGANLALAHLALRNGRSAGSGGALSAETDAASITLLDCVLEDNATTGADSVGGGASLVSASGDITVSGSAFRRNASTGNVGGLYAATGDGTVTLTGSTFVANTVANTGGNPYFGDAGGAMLYTGASGHAVATGNLFDGNSAAGGSNPDGGGLMTYQLGPGVVATVTGNTFTANHAGLSGGGCIVRINDSGSAEFSGNTLDGNWTLAGTGGGAELYVNDGTLTMADLEVTGNDAAGSGGGLWVHLGSGTAVLEDSTFTGNGSGDNGGGASLFVDSGSLEVRRSVAADNTAAGVGGGLSLATATGSLALANDTLFANQASGGAALYCYFDQATATSSLRNLILWGDQPDELDYSWGSGSGTFALTYSDVEGGTGQPWFGTGSISADPLFVDPAALDLRLGWASFPVPDATRSPCIDSGDPASPDDPDGTRADMGALPFDQSGLQPLFADGFESGTTGAWSTVGP